MATISTHNGSTISFAHNRREPEIVSREKHIDPNGRHEIWSQMGESLRDAYGLIFGDAQAEYNKKQKRADRKIVSYYDEFLEKVAKQQERYDAVKRENEKLKAAGAKLKHLPVVQKPCYEMVVGVYPEKGDVMTEEQKIKMLHAWFYGDDNHPGFQERNPNMVVVGCYLHADEPNAGIHLHLDYVPVGHGYERGMDAQNSLDRGLKEQPQGFISTGNGQNALTAQKMFEAYENDILSDIVTREGFVVSHPQRGKDVLHLDTSVYKRKKLQEKEQELDEREEAIAEVEDEAFSMRNKAHASEVKNKADAKRLERQKAEQDAKEQELAQAISAANKARGTANILLTKAEAAFKGVTELLGDNPHTGTEKGQDDAFKAYTDRHPYPVRGKDGQYHNYTLTQLEAALRKGFEAEQAAKRREAQAVKETIDSAKDSKKAAYAADTDLNNLRRQILARDILQLDDKIFDSSAEISADITYGG